MSNVNVFSDGEWRRLHARVVPNTVELEEFKLTMVNGTIHTLYLAKDLHKIMQELRDILREHGELREAANFPLSGRKNDLSRAAAAALRVLYSRSNSCVDNDRDYNNYDNMTNHNVRSDDNNNNSNKKNTFYSHERGNYSASHRVSLNANEANVYSYAPLPRSPPPSYAAGVIPSTNNNNSESATLLPPPLITNPSLYNSLGESASANKGHFTSLAEFAARNGIHDTTWPENEHMAMEINNNFNIDNKNLENTETDVFRPSEEVRINSGELEPRSSTRMSDETNMDEHRIDTESTRVTNSNTRMLSRTPSHSTRTPPITDHIQEENNNNNNGSSNNNNENEEPSPHSSTFVHSGTLSATPERQHSSSRHQPLAELVLHSPQCTAGVNSSSNHLLHTGQEEQQQLELESHLNNEYKEQQQQVDYNLEHNAELTDRSLINIVHNEIENITDIHSHATSSKLKESSWLEHMPHVHTAEQAHSSEHRSSAKLSTVLPSSIMPSAKLSTGLTNELVAVNEYSTPFSQVLGIITRFQLRYGSRPIRFDIPVQFAQAVHARRLRVQVIPFRHPNLPARWPTAREIVLYVNDQCITHPWRRSWPEREVAVAKTFLPLDITQYLTRVHTSADGNYNSRANGHAIQRLQIDLFNKEYFTPAMLVVSQPFTLEEVVERMLEKKFNEPRREVIEHFFNKSHLEFQPPYTSIDTAADTVDAGNMSVKVKLRESESQLSAFYDSIMNVDDGDELEADDPVISTLCPISRTPIEIPIRGKECKHLQCVDLQSYLVSSNKGCYWNCALCDREVRVRDVVIDTVLWCFLFTHRENCAPYLRLSQIKSSANILERQLRPYYAWRIASANDNSKGEAIDSDDGENEDKSYDENEDSEHNYDKHSLNETNNNAFDYSSVTKKIKLEEIGKEQLDYASATLDVKIGREEHKRIRSDDLHGAQGTANAPIVLDEEKRRENTRKKN